MIQHDHKKLLGLIVGTCMTTAALFGQSDFDEQFEHWPVVVRINGTIVVDHGLKSQQRWQDMLRQLGGKKTKIFMREAADSRMSRRLSKLPDEKRETLKVIPFKKLNAKGIRESLLDCDTLVIDCANSLSSEESRAILDSKKALQEFIHRGGTICVDAEFGSRLGEFFVEEADGKRSIVAGLNLFLNCVLQMREKADDSGREATLKVLSTHPRTVGVELTDDSALVLRGRRIQVVGSGTATFLLAANQRQAARIETIETPTRERYFSEIIDLTEWRRDAIDRTLEPFPVKKPQKPVVENGTLIIVGGGGMPRGLMGRMIELAGGKEKAKMVYVPCSERADVGKRHGMVTMWKRMGVKHATFIHTKDRNRANEDEAFLAPLKDATGIWFGGGRQWNFSDSYYGTRAHKLMKEVLKRGGVIGGSSAGASIQARYLARATPIGNTRIMAPGYERGGLGFISGVAIDQHFSQRGRQKDMTQLVNRHPQLLGIGIDESTAIVVQGSKAEVVGRGKVFFYDRNQPVVDGEPDYLAVPAGGSFDLETRKVIE